MRIAFCCTRLHIFQGQLTELIVTSFETVSVRTLFFVVSAIVVLAVT